MQKEKVVLVVEDNLEELERISNSLTRESLTVLSAQGTAMADDLLAKVNNQPDKQLVCIIFDLNMSNEFLDKELQNKSEMGRLTGWVWHYYAAKPYIEEHFKNINLKAVVNSAFIENLCRKLEAASINIDEKRFFNTQIANNKMLCIPKEDAVSNVDALIQGLRKLGII